MPDHSHALSDEQIQAALETQIKRTFQLNLDLRVLLTALKKKGLLTESDIAEATEQVTREWKEAHAILGEPPGGIQ